MAAIAALHLSPRKTNCSVIDMAVVESPILIYTLLDSSSMSRCMHLSIYKLIEAKKYANYTTSINLH
jgi:hypothetical protein